MQIRPIADSHTVKIDPVPLSERIATISRKLSEQGFGTFRELIDRSQGKMGVVVSFVAVLELIKRGLVGFMQADPDDETDAKPTKKSKKLAENTGHDLANQTLYWLH